MIPDDYDLHESFPPPRPMARQAPPAGRSQPPRWMDIFFMVCLGWFVLATASCSWWLGGLLRTWLRF